MKITKKQIKEDVKVLGKFLKAKHVAEILGVSRNTAKARFKDGSIQGVIFMENSSAEEYLFYRESVEDFLNQ